MKCSWYVQENLSKNGAQELQEACEKQGRDFHGFKIRPFVERMPRLKAERPFVLSGSTTLNRNAAKSKKYRSGIFFHHSNFRPEMYVKKYGSAYLNADTIVCKIKDLNDNAYDLNQVLFIRSNDDSKNISGGTLTFGELLVIKNNTQTHYLSGDIFTPDSEICIASEKDVNAEWRLIVVNRQVVTGSQYRPVIDSYVPEEVIDFGNLQARIWQPHDVFVMDICTSNDELKIVECNCFNGSGYYASDMDKIVQSVSEYQESKTID